MTTATTISPEVFEKVAAIVGDKNIKPIRSSTMSEKFRFYGLYKRATLGKLLPPYDSESDTKTESRPTSRPGFLNVEGRGKYDAWKEADKLTKQEARDAYVQLALETIGEPVSKLMEEEK